ncbi:MAG: hypothetical protein FJ098_12290 [Deltaproteobacteria bacterium]|nr:hypothetical protein [Deltaproteobacteria bacterium]
MLWPDDLMVLVALLFAGRAAWTDLRPVLPHLLGRIPFERSRGGRIPNRVLLLGLLAGLSWHLGAWAWHGAGGEIHSATLLAGQSLSYAAQVALNAAASALLGFILWALGLWAAGDGKLFGLLSLLLPLASYSRNFFPVFPSFVLLFNTFIAVFAILVLELVLQLSARVTRGGRGYLAGMAGRGWRLLVEHRIRVLKLVLLFLAIFTLIRVLRHFAREALDLGFGPLNKTLVYVILFLLFKPITGLLRFRATLWASGVLLAGYLVWALALEPTGEAARGLVDVGAFTLSILAFRGIYDAYLKATDERRIPPALLRPGMLLSDESLRKFRERREFCRRWLDPLEPDGLTAAQVDAIQGWYQENDAGGLVGVARTIPFAPALFLGVILTVVQRGLLLVL